MDNIHLNTISPLLSSPERVKRVGRRARDSEQSPDEGDLQEKQKKKHPGGSASLSEATPAKDLSQSPGDSATHLPEDETNPPGGWGKRVIDIRI